MEFKAASISAPENLASPVLISSWQIPYYFLVVCLATPSVVITVATPVAGIAAVPIVITAAVPVTITAAAPVAVTVAVPVASSPYLLF
ncbi:hypothetical protein TorRG33x02_145510 [Trema orientale]|uniref:Uncharacterized protein n=1 Tax=Trema orientale TaxID=63057 RepID=A0A2P5EVZ8_TREOI|nr:hypothetical protein TorRG33x02_145510 [Trema orientale]